MKKRRRTAIIFFVLSIVWMLFIWGNSLQPGSTSGNMSGTITEKINELLKIFGEDAELPHLFIRKAAHFLEFAALSLLLSFCAFNFFELKPTDSYARNSLSLLALPASVLVAAIDETIQLFVDGRVGAITDVLIDTSGAAMSALVFFAILVLFKRRISKEK